MIVPQFLRFYTGYTASSALAEYGKTFFALVNSMYRLQADETIVAINTTAAGSADATQRNAIIEKLQKGAKGLHGILEEVRNIKNVKH